MPWEQCSTKSAFGREQCVIDIGNDITVLIIHK